MVKYLFILLLAFCSVATARESTLIIDTTSNLVVHGRDYNRVRPIASVTKLMTAVVALNHSFDMNKLLRMSGRVGGYLPPGLYTRQELLDAMLVRSDNAAAETLAADYPGGRRAFIKAMNNTARDLGLKHTRFVDPSGLGIGNVSTAMEVAKLTQAAAKFDWIKESSTKPQTQIHRTSLKNTNTPLLFKHNSIVTSSKTGFTRPAGFCVALSLEKYDSKYIVVVLGSTSPTSRFNTANHLINTHVAKTPFREYNLSKI